MYRIKMTEDLEKLKDFGYEEDKNGNYSKRVMKDTNKAWTYFETIEIHKDDRIIRTRLYQDCADQVWYGYIEKKERFIEDLDKAGIIEEVKEEKNNLVTFAENELNIIINKCEDEESTEMQEMISKDILQVVEIFSQQGHSGFSANYAINLINKLLRYEPITPLTGADDEWNELSYDKDTKYQNKRCSRVFKDADGKAYDIEGKIFSDDGGKSWYQSKDSRVYIEFPYIPKTERIILKNQEDKDETI